jgi:DNA-directed RNA polymerase subunit M/transcription elongation factor TFIIS
MKKCISCGNEIHPKRLEILPSTTRCVSCSNTKQKAGITVTKGEGDHTYNETIIMEHDEYVKYKELEAKINKTSFEETPVEDHILPNDVDEEGDELDFSNIGE